MINNYDIKLTNKGRLVMFPVAVLSIYCIHFGVDIFINYEGTDPILAKCVGIVFAIMCLAFGIWSLMFCNMKIHLVGDHIKVTVLFLSKDFDIDQITKVTIYRLPRRCGIFENMILFVEGKKLILPHPIGEDMKNYSLFYSRIMELNVPVERVCR